MPALFHRVGDLTTLPSVAYASSTSPCTGEARIMTKIKPQGTSRFFTRHPEPSQRFYTSSRTKPKVLHVIPNECEGSPRLLQPVPCEGIPRFADFAPMGLVRRFVEMLLQAGISPRVGRNDTLRWSFEQATNHAASKTILFRSMVGFDNPSVLPSAIACHGLSGARSDAAETE